MRAAMGYERRNWDTSTACFVADPTGMRRQRSASQGGDGLYLDQERLLHQAVDDKERVGRIGPAGKHPRKLTQPERHELRDVLRMHEVGRELNDIGEGRALRFERGLDIGEDLPALGVEVVGADGLAA